MKNLVAIKKTFKNDKGEEIIYSQYYLWLKNVLGHDEFIPIKVVGDRIAKMSIDTYAVYFDNLTLARNYMLENNGK